MALGVVLGSTTQATELSFGGTAGLVGSRLDVDGWGGSARQSNVALGGFVSVVLGPSVSFRPGVTYVRRGGEFLDQTSHPGGSLEVVSQASYEVDYIEIPILVRYRLAPDSRFSPVLIAGPVWRLAISSEGSWQGRETDDWVEESGLAVEFGAGFESGLGRYVGSVDVVYSRSLGEVGDGVFYTEGSTFADGIGVRLGFAY